MKGELKNPIDESTVKAVDIIVSFLTPEEKGLLDITLNGQTVTIAEQLCSRGGSQVPISENPIVFRSEVAQILKTNKRWLALMAQLRNEDFLLKLLDPENYKETHTKTTGGKTVDKRQINSINDNTSLVKTIGRNINGTGGTNRDTDYSSMWDRSDRARLDKLTIKRPELGRATSETGDEDDSGGASDEFIPKPADIKNGINKSERLDRSVALRQGKDRAVATFGDNHEEIEEKTIGIFDLHLSHGVNSTLSDNAISGETFVDAQKRQGFITFKDRIVLAEAINNIHNVEFPNIHEKFFKLFDPLFKHVHKSCQ